MTEPLQILEDKEVEWCWLQQHQKAFTTVKQHLVEAPVLKYYNIKDVTIQCDASKTVLGIVLMQNEQPIAYASSTLADTETLYAQIEENYLQLCGELTSSISTYLEVVHIESDHEPLKVTKETPEDVNDPSELYFGCAVQEEGTYADIRCS